MQSLLLSPEERLARQLNLKLSQVKAAIGLLNEGATVPFIARYRKEATDGLSDTHLRDLETQWQYLKELDDRRETILKSIEEQGQLTPALKDALLMAETKAVLEDLYLPFRPKRRTKAQIAKEAGLLSLAEALIQNPNLVPETEAQRYLNPEKDITTLAQALDGAANILIERFAESSDLVGRCRERLWRQGRVCSKMVKGKAEEGAKFKDYFEFDEPVGRIPSHRALALFRGEKEGILKVRLSPAPADAEEKQAIESFVQTVGRAFRIEAKNRPADAWLADAVTQSWKTKLFPHLETDILSTIKDNADLEAIRVFAVNMKDLLLAAPAGPKVTLGLDPGFRTGVKWVVVDATGKLLEYGVIYPHEPQKRWQDALNTLAAQVQKHRVSLISIGNGTASRETDKLAQELLKSMTGPPNAQKVQKIVVSEAGASVYSASELGAKEFPDLDVSYRGAVSIARRLQDPLAELVKIDPKAIGVGQYQHDVNQKELSRMLDAVVQDCVNAVGVDLNMASVPLLSYVSGLTPTLAKNIVAFRDENGAFTSRTRLKKVPRLGDKVFEQCAGFLRIREGDNPLDASSVHPESYPLVERILKQHGQALNAVIGNRPFIASVDPKRFVDDRFGLPTIQDILSELEKPGRDPRPEFKTATFQEGIESICDLQPGMTLEGVVTNVTNFGAFVDIGVHQDGLVHISQLSNTFVKDPHQVVHPGQVVKVRVVEVDPSRKRISLTMKF